MGLPMTDDELVFELSRNDVVSCRIKYDDGRVNVGHGLLLEAVGLIHRERAESARLRAEVEALKAEDSRLRNACSKENDDICQTLGRALGYPKFVDDPAFFPGATEADGVCIGDHVAASLACEAADMIAKPQGEVEALKATLTQQCKGYRADVEKLEAEVEALRADAERYRWLRKSAGRGAAAAIFDNFSAEAIDKCIDAARAAQGEQR